MALSMMLAVWFAALSTSGGPKWSRGNLLEVIKEDEEQHEDIVVEKLEQRQTLKLYTYNMGNLSDCSWAAVGFRANAQVQKANMAWEPSLHRILSQLHTKHIVRTTDPTDADLFHIPVCFSGFYFHRRGGCTPEATRLFASLQQQVVDVMVATGA
jgi:hypothetical protein